MKRVLIYASIGLLALASGAFIAALQAQLRSTVNSAPAPTVPAPTARPEVIPVNTPTQVTVTVPISDPRVIPTGVNLLRVNATGSSTNLGRMYDDATHNDAVANDGVFTLQIAIDEPVVGSLYLGVSVAFRGLLRRVTSDPATVQVVEWVRFNEPTIPIQLEYPPTDTIRGGGGTFSFSSVTERSPLSDEALQNESLFIVSTRVNVNPQQLDIEEWFAANLGPGQQSSDPISVGTATVGGRKGIRMETPESVGLVVYYFVSHGTEVIEFSHGLYAPQFLPTYQMMLDSVEFVE